MPGVFQFAGPVVAPNRFHRATQTEFRARAPPLGSTAYGPARPNHQGFRVSAATRTRQNSSDFTLETGPKLGGSLETFAAKES